MVNEKTEKAKRQEISLYPSDLQKALEKANTKNISEAIRFCIRKAPKAATKN